METMKLQWKGSEPTRVRLEKNGEKVEVKVDEIFECSKEVATEYMKSSKSFVLATEKKKVEATEEPKAEKPKAKK